MINIIFIYLCFWVFISSYFIRWVVGLNCPPKLSKTERDLLSDKCNELELTKQKLSNSLSKCEKLTKEAKSYENINTSKIIKDLTGEGIVVYCPEFNRNVLFKMNDKEIEKYNR